MRWFCRLIDARFGGKSEYYGKIWRSSLRLGEGVGLFSAIEVKLLMDQGLAAPLGAPLLPLIS